MPDLRARELWAVGPLIALIIVLGVYPKPVIDVINPAVHSTLVQAHSTNPVPPHPAPRLDEPSSRLGDFAVPIGGGFAPDQNGGQP